MSHQSASPGPGRSTRRPAPIPCAVIGTGRIGSSLETDRLREKPASHAGAIHHHPKTRLVAGADPEPEQLAAFGRLWHLPASALFADPAVLLDTVRPGIVHLAADTAAHAGLLRLCLDRQVPVIVLEKPVAATLDQARELLPLVRQAEAAGSSRVVVNHERRFARDYRQARGLIDSGSLGRLLSIHCRLFMGRTRAVEQVLWHDGTHLVDILRFLAGDWEPLAVHGSVKAGGGNVLVLGQTRPQDGSTGTAGPAAPASICLEVSPGRDHLVFELDLGFSAGRLRIGNGLYEEWVSEPSKLYEHFRSLAPRTRPGHNPWQGRTAYFANMMAHAVDLYRNPALASQSSYGDGLAALEILDRIITLAG